MKVRLIAILFSIVCVCGTARAASIDMVWDNNPLNPAATDQIHYYLNTSDEWVYPDRYHGTATNLIGVNGGELVDGVNGSLFTYCYELTQYFYGGSTVHYVLDSSGITAQTLDFLGGVNSVLGGSPYAWLYPLGSYTPTGGSTIPVANIAAAIQIGIWETRYDSSWNLASGAFHATGIDSATQTALDLFHGAAGTHDSLDPLTIVRLTNPDRQDQITAFRPTSREQTVPEPGSLALIGIGMAATAFARRRSRASKQA